MVILQNFNWINQILLKFRDLPVGYMLLCMFTTSPSQFIVWSWAVLYYLRLIDYFLTVFISITTGVCVCWWARKLNCSISAYILMWPSPHTEGGSRSSIYCSYSSICLMVKLNCILPPHLGQPASTAAPSCLNKWTKQTHLDLYIYFCFSLSALFSDICSSDATALERSEETGINKH